MDNTWSLIESALNLPATVIAYHAGRRLLELYPGKAMLECSSCGFDLDGFVDAGHASVTFQNGQTHNQSQTAWRGCQTDPRMAMFAACLSGEGGIQHRPLNAHFQVQWMAHRFEGIVLTWGEAMSMQRIYFLVGESRALLEEFFGIVCEWSAIPHGEVLVFEQGGWRKDQRLYQSIQAATFESLILAPGLKEGLQKDVQCFFARHDVYAQYGVPWKRGLLLVGPPGNGKTHAVKALCRSAGVPVLYLRSLEPAGVFHGSEHANISQVFDQARKTAPCLLVLEDLDALVKPSNRSLFLNELDGFAENAGVCVVATTNFPERLDPSLLDRPSRFDRKYTFNIPGVSERVAYLEHWNNQQSLDLRLTGSGLLAVAEATEGFSFAYLKELCLAATMAWINAEPRCSMDPIAAEQARALREQMRNAPGELDASASPLSRRERLAEALRGG
jgi:hypothetical protein